MSTGFRFTGKLSVPIVVYNNVFLWSDSDRSFKTSTPVCLNANTSGPPETRCYNYLFNNPNDASITWDGNPALLAGLSINQIYSSPFFANADIQINQTYTFTQTAGVQDLNNGRIQFYLLNSDQTQLGSQTYIIIGTAGGGQTKYEAPGLNFQVQETSTSSGSLTTIAGLQAIAWNDLGGALGNQPVSGAAMELQIDVVLQIFCNTGNATSSPCLNLCTSTTAGLTQCLPLFTIACLNNQGTDGQAFIFGSTGCQSYFADYMSSDIGPGPSSDLDTAFTRICAARFPGATLDQYRNAGATDQQICGCHLNSQIYANLQASLARDFPGSQFAGEITQCLFPECVNSPYKNIHTGKMCPIPQCFELSSINNQGQFDGRIIVNQTCSSLKEPGSAHTPGQIFDDTKSWIEKHWVWVVVGVALVVVLIIIVLILSASGGSKKKKEKFPEV